MGSSDGSGKGAAKTLWECKACSFKENFGWRDACWKCGGPRSPKGGARGGKGKGKGDHSAKKEGAAGAKPKEDDPGLAALEARLRKTEEEATKAIKQEIADYKASKGQGSPHPWRTAAVERKLRDQQRKIERTEGEVEKALVEIEALQVKLVEKKELLEKQKQTKATLEQRLSEAKANSGTAADHLELAAKAAETNPALAGSLDAFRALLASTREVETRQAAEETPPPSHPQDEWPARTGEAINELYLRNATVAAITETLAGQTGANQEMVAAVVAATDRVFGAGRPRGRRRKLEDRVGDDASIDDSDDE